ncbi:MULTISPECIES: hypothetical protein [unclassified Streptomyces]|nr:MULTISPECIES: hypothetical protein [unclassified Streptomyces]
MTPPPLNHLHRQRLDIALWGVLPYLALAVLVAGCACPPYGGRPAAATT